MKAPNPETLVERNIVDRVQRVIRETGCTKRSAIRLALIEAINEGCLKAGALLPPERRLAEALGISLGTVQAALGELRQAGRVTRRRGDGTRVASFQAFGPSTWHFRLLERRTAKPVFWVKSEVDVAEVTTPGPWTEFLAETGRVVRVRRRIEMLGGLPVAADMYLPRSFGKPLLRMNTTDLALTNLRTILSDRYDVEPGRLSTQIAVRSISELEATTFCLPNRINVFEIDARVYTKYEDPFYFQRVIAGVDYFCLQF